MFEPFLIPGLIAIVALAMMFFFLTNSESDSGGDNASSLGSMGSSVSWGSQNSAQNTGRTRTRRVMPPDEKARKTLRNRLVQAGLYRKNSKGYYLMVQGLMAGIPFAAAMALSSMGFIPQRLGLLVALAVGIAGIVFPGLWLDAKKTARQTSIRRALPDALDVIVVCVEAGLSMDAALQRVTRELQSAHPLLAMELSIVQKESSLGANIGTALKHFADRFDLEELRSLAAVTQQAERFGSSIANALRTYAETLREKRLQAARERAQKAAVILLLPTVICIFPAMFVVILGPAVYRVIEAMSRVR